jgi:2-phospho-L-lactate guanylyltransferase
MAQPRTWAVVPVKRLADAKSRLADVIGPTERQAFCLAMLDDVLAALGQTPGLAGTLVVTADDEAAAHARAAGARVVDEAPVAGLNAALDLAVAALASKRADRLFILPADVPLVTPESLAPLLAADDGVTLVTDRAGVGTNALLMAPIDALPFRFGPSSLERHLKEAQARGLPVRVCDIPELALDIDTPDDLDALMAVRSARRRA